MLLIDDLLLAPFKGIFHIFKEIHKRVEEEFYDEEHIINQMRSLQTSLQLGDITEEEYDQAEEDLVERLQITRERNAERSEEE